MPTRSRFLADRLPGRRQKVGAGDTAASNRLPGGGGTWQSRMEAAKLFAWTENSMHIGSLLALGFLLAHGLVSAQTAEASPPLSLDAARAQRVRAKTLKDEAEKRYETEKAVCQSKAIAFSCMSSAKERRAEELKAADTLGREARQAEREAHRVEVEAKAAKREAEAPAREAKQQADIERYREKEAQRAAERERRLAEEPAMLESRRGKAATEKAAQTKRLEDRKREDASRAANAPAQTKKRAERERQHAERVKKIDERARQYAELLKRREAEAAAKQAVSAK